MTRTYDVPAGWLARSASRTPLRLVNAFAFAKSSTPPPDQWTHFAKLRPVPWKLVGAFALIAAFCVWGIVSTLIQFAEELEYAIFPLVLMAAGALFFGWATVNSVVSYGTRTGWPHLHGVGIGESGIAFRLTGGDADVPWDAVTSIRATFTNEDNPRKANIPVLRVEYAGSRVDLNTQILGASPIVTYWALIYYWMTKESRGELGTTVAQERMDGWLTQVTATAAPRGLAAPEGPAAPGTPGATLAEPSQ
ncbi:hypothetical protein B0I08_106280 [Glaciihabitans tibetensis]|uniref:Uncharacterized protein n=1 Tax=Glaciihabitans tibetensis TaxID=1266600 RepID=A0A2T0VBZ0_9MICO|nr:hypothetical protein [Glaciihabitans tibetensis]PRY67672.1 hypothetical protein B0I08_106280 [Glaciihabitans tibetensis]